MPPKRKSNASRAKEAAKRRALESDADREARLSQQRERQASLRENESSPERSQRLSQAQSSMCALRQRGEGTPEKTQRLSRIRANMTTLRRQENTPDRLQRISQVREHTTALRQQETSPERLERLSQARKRITALRQEETSPERLDRLAQARERMTALRQEETSPHRLQRLTQNREHTTASRQEETSPERLDRLAQARERMTAFRQEETTPDRLQRTIQNRERMSTLRQRETTPTISRRRSFDRNQKSHVRRERRSQSLSEEMAVSSSSQLNSNSENDRVEHTLFEKYQMSLKWNICYQCNEKVLSHKTLGNICSRCTKFSNKLNPFSKENNMDPGEQPLELRDLSFVEEQLISRVHPVISVYRIQGQQYGYSGQVINFPQEVNDVAKQLPRSLSTLSSILIVRKETADNYVDFRVNRRRVERALLYLRNNNIFYKDIEVNNEALNALPENGNIFQENADVSIHRQNESSIAEVVDTNIMRDGVVVTDAPNSTIAPEKTIQIESLLKEDSAKIAWPEISAEPINEFSTVGYVAMAFPTLFPTGDADLRSPRQVKVSPLEYFRHLLQYKDERFAKNPRFRFFAMNSSSRWSSLQNGKICLQRNSDLADLTAADLKERFKQDPGLVRRLICYNSTVRGTAAYWKARCGELLDMVQQLGPPTLFFTLSAADLHWPELYRILDPSTDYSTLSKSAAFKRRSDLLNDNPMVVDHFFHLRADFFIREVVVPHFDVEDFWYRTEFQHRGSPHIHGVIWITNAPDVSELDNADENTLSQIAQFFDNIVSTTNPQINAQLPLVHPCQTHYSEVGNHEEDYANLINCCQRHTRHGAQCIRRNKTTGMEECRFKFPFPLQEQTVVTKEKGQWEIVTRRNDPLINRHNRFVTEHWRANTDMQCILSVEAVLNYIAKYASKAEPRSKAMEELLADALSKEEDSAKTAVQKLFIRMCCERDYSAQETFHIMMGWPLYHCSRAFVKVNVEHQQWIPVADETEEQGPVARKSVLDTYPLRPVELQNMPLIELFSKYYKKGIAWVRRRRPAVVRVIPKHRSNSDNKEAYFRQQVLLHVPWQDISEFAGRSWEEHYSLIAQHPEPLQLPQVDEEYEDVAEDQPGDLDEWMVIAGVGPNGALGPAVEIGCRDIDRSFDWSQSYSLYADPLNLPSFLSLEKQSDTENPTIWEVPKVIFSREQQSIIELLKRQIVALKDEYAERQPQMSIIQGKAGSGKSTIIKSVCAFLSEELGQQSFRLLAPTGAAAVNVSGATIHSGLSISIGHSHSELGAEQAQKLQDDLSNCHFLIIDEMSMLGCSLFKKIDLRCRESKPTNCDKPFGGMYLYLLGDIKQLPPVLDRPFYGSGFKGTLHDQGQILYKSIPLCFVLSISYRQQGADQRLFRDLLDRLSVGESTVEDWRLLMTRERSVLSQQEVSGFSESVRLYPQNVSVSNYNLRKLESLNQPTAKIPADNNCAEAAKADYETAQGLEKILYLCVGSRVMLKTNLWVKKGLVNGAIGTVADIVYQPGKLPPNERPLAICVKFDNYTGPSLNNAVPIASVTRSWKSGNVSCSRTQFPLILAWAVTIHKSQGLTLPKVVVDIGEKELAPGCTYVALSRAKRLCDIMFDPGFNLDRLTRIKNMKLLGQRVEEERRLLSLTM